MIKTTLLAAAAVLAAAPAGATVTYNLVQYYGFGSNGSAVAGGGVDTSYAAAGGDTAISGQALNVNGGTAIASYSGSTAAGATAVVGSSDLFDFAPSTKGKVRLSLSGFVNTMGNGIADITYRIAQADSRGGFIANMTGDLGSCGDCSSPTDLLGLHKLNRALSFSMRGGDVLTIALTAAAANNAPGSFGFAQAYIDPVMTMGAVPEPKSWAMLIAGFGLTAAAMRRRHTLSVVTA